MKKYKEFISSFFLILLVSLMSWTWDFFEIVKISNGAEKLDHIYESILQPPHATLVLKSYEREFQRYAVYSYCYPMEEGDVIKFFDDHLKNDGWENMDIVNENDRRWIKIRRYMKGNLEFLLLREVGNLDKDVWNIKISFLPYMKSWNKETEKIVLEKMMYSVERALMAAGTYFIFSSIYILIKRMK